MSRSKMIKAGMRNPLPSASYKASRRVEGREEGRGSVCVCVSNFCVTMFRLSEAVEVYLISAGCFCSAVRLLSHRHT